MSDCPCTRAQLECDPLRSKPITAIRNEISLFFGTYAIHRSHVETSSVLGQEAGYHREDGLVIGLEAQHDPTEQDLNVVRC